MKEEKKVRKRTASTRDARVPKPVPVDQALIDPPLPLPQRAARSKTRTQKRATRAKQRKVEDDSDSDFSPVKRSR